MKILKHLLQTAISLTITALSTLHSQDMPSPQEMWHTIQEQQKQIDALTALLNSTRNEIAATRDATEFTKQGLLNAQDQIEATTIAVEDYMEKGTDYSTGLWEKTQFGGYGELHANFISGADNEIDFHRFVLYFGHDFNDWIHLFSELEIEHADSSANGAVELEQAFLNFHLTDSFSIDTGLMLVPIGILNEIHEPDTFYGVERNRVETNIIPTTWREGGILGHYRSPIGISMDAGIISGLDLDTDIGGSDNIGRIRSGRQKGSEAPLNSGAGLIALNYSGIPGLELGLSTFYQNDLAQTSSEDISGLLSEFHMDYKRNGFGLRALYARWDLDADNNSNLPITAEEQFGYYIEPSYRFKLDDIWGDIGIFLRYSNYEFQRSSTAFFDNEIWELGINYWPAYNVVLKIDYQDLSEAEEFTGNRAVNLGIGYQY